MTDCPGASANEALTETVPEVEKSSENCVQPSAEIDITADFFAQCSKLQLGELAKCDYFQLSEAMSAIELMDPKMDIGMVPFDSSIRFENLVAHGLLNVDHMEKRELIATMDALMSALVSWLEGNSLAQTLLTCVCLHNVEAISDPVLLAFCRAIQGLTLSFTCIVQTAAVYEEEDFNFYSHGFSPVSLHDLVDSLKTAQALLQNKRRKKKEDVIIDALSSRLSFVHLILLSIHSLVALPSHPVDGAQNMVPNTEEVCYYMKWIFVDLDKIESTIELGMQPSEQTQMEDGDFGWLPAFEPDVTRPELPPTFPRKTKMLNRVDSVKYLRKLCERILRIATELPSKVATIDSTLSFLKSFSLDGSCVLTRSLLQLTYLPADFRVLGRTPFAAVVIDSFRASTSPPVLSLTDQTYWTVECKAIWEEFVDIAVRVFLGVIQMFGQNITRQREIVVCVIDDLSELYNEAVRVQREFEKYVRLRPPTEMRTDYLPMFILRHILLLAEYHFCLSFRLDLFAPYEYPYVYWFMNDIIFKSLHKTTDVAETTLTSHLGQRTRSKRKNKKKGKTSSNTKQPHFSKRIADIERYSRFYQAQMALCEAMFKSSIGLIMCGKIRVPDGDRNAEHLRFEHRMMPFESLSQLIPFSYASFIESSRCYRIEKSDCFVDAANAFERANAELKDFEGQEPLDREALAIAELCKQNAAVSLSLSKENKTDSRIEFVFNRSTLMYPLLKII
ncbi:hypothetical protein AB6A40_000817 [Gnathostoma spinigerum]|uniref:Protein MAK10 homolog n=1 Tax=Gnathostoma spinigerum TaxID=75299 RepID=A0ABD6E2U3_9BILA